MISLSILLIMFSIRLCLGISNFQMPKQPSQSFEVVLQVFPLNFITQFF